MGMKEVKEYLLEKLKEMDLEEEELASMDATTLELGLSSLELVDLADALNTKFGSSIKLEPNKELSLQEICEMVVAQKKATE